MRSIRRSLTLYFLALLGLGLGAVAVLTDEVIGPILDARSEATTKLIHAGHQERTREAREKLDADLFNEAQALYSRLLLQYTTSRFEHQRRFGAWLAVHEGLFEATPFGRPVWSAGATNRGGVLALAARTYFEHLPLTDTQSAADQEPAPGAHNDLWQINVTGRVAGPPRSHGVGGSAFPTDAPPLDQDKPFDLAYMTQVWNGAEVRRLLFKGPLTAAARFGGPGPGGRGGPPNRPREVGPPAPPRDRDREPPPPPDRSAEPLPRVYVNVARPVAVLHAETARSEVIRDDQLVALAEDIGRDRNRLRTWMAGIGLATFLGIVLGGPTLIGRGLGPLRRLSDAVSRVSEKDFRLPVGRDAMSRELLPIHARLTDTLDDLRRAFEREKQAVADISHELRTPVAGLLATIDVTLRKPRTADQYKTALEESRAIGRQLAGLVERVMTLAALDAGADRTSTVETDAAELADGCALVIRPLAVANGISFEADLAGPVPVVTDPDKLREVVINLLHNAVEYNRPGGSIRLAVRATAGGGAEVEVADTGIGMTPDVRDRIFERFYRADASRHAAGAHAGLGLSIVKEYVGRLGGTITVESEAGVGSTFRVTLPAAPEGSEGAAEPELAVTA